MLKALELSGFKSFADKTRFEFPPGITVVVGPNGSGKSNIVDAIKWVLGEQSAKSLRGKEMSDVIFKGSSGANARKPAGAAVATLILENADGRLMSDCPEVQVTRRVYRSGESEYLINGQPCRLKDIRDLFRGTGVGTEAYSLIEQGKVERLLQAGAKERRAIFEEAAGISRFKAKKIEAERRLERVELNLTRLADIVDEVGNRYRAIKSQAAKAARYRECTQRLQQLRTEVGVKDYRAFTEKIAANDARLAEFRLAAESLQQQIVDLQAQSSAQESQLDASAAEVAALQEHVGNLREALAQAESAAELNRRRRGDLQQRQQQLAVQAQRLAERRQDLQKALAQAEQELQAAQATATQASVELTTLAEQLAQLLAEESASTSRAEASRERQQQLQTRTAELTLRLRSASTQREANQQARERWAAELTQLDEDLHSRADQQRAIEQRREAAEKRAAENDSALERARREGESLHQEIGETQQNLAELRARFAGVSQRSKLIEELEKRFEGIQAGTRELLQQSRTPGRGVLASVLGLVADFVQVNIQHATLVDAALGPIAQYVVLADDQLQRELAEGRFSVAGRVTLVAAKRGLNLQVDPGLDLTEQPGVVGPLLELVELPESQADFVRQLLAGTWIVKSLAVGRELQSRFPGRARYVTLDGEVVESDGTLVVGPKAAAAGIVSRRSELRALHLEQAELKSQIGSLEELLSQFRQSLGRCEAEARRLLGLNQASTAELNELATAEETNRFQTKSLAAQQAKADGELRAVQQQIEELKQQIAADESDQAAVARQAETCRLELAATQKQAVELAQTRRLLEHRVTSAKVALAKAEQQLVGAEASHRAHHASLEESCSESERLGVQAAADLAALAAAEQDLELASGQARQLAAERESLAEQLNQLLSTRGEVDRQRKTLAEQLRLQRQAQRTAEEALGECSVRARQLSLEREQLAQRLRDDYGLEVEQLLGSESAEAVQSREEIDREITELRQKIGALGAVNLQALAELEELEQRYQLLDQQYQDLTNAKESLLKIIHKINNDSRRLFTDTLEAIRSNFQKLFRQTFGGGNADIVLEEGVDVLEAGVEIIATPPGKPKFSNSLLSGGEKALTAVSLLMAIFQFRPSPFCVLDEVDAPFDEANIGRFIDVLKSFLGWTKFVIVTHSKKTMTAATTLYGITMQESGVSKRVSVRFEDVSEDGRISEDAVRRTDREGAARNSSDGEQTAVA